MNITKEQKILSLCFIGLVVVATALIVYQLPSAPKHSPYQPTLESLSQQVWELKNTINNQDSRIYKLEGSIRDLQDNSHHH